VSGDIVQEFLAWEITRSGIFDLEISRHHLIQWGILHENVASMQAPDTVPHIGHCPEEDLMSLVPLTNVEVKTVATGHGCCAVRIFTGTH
jgi:hypothetical protein